MNPLIGLGGLAAVLATLLALSQCQNGKLHEQLGKKDEQIELANTEVAEAKEANESNLAALEECRVINAENEGQRDSARHRAELAEVRAASAEARLQESINDFDTQEFQSDATCRTLSDPLPSDLVGRLCIDAAANCADPHGDGNPH